MNTKTYLGNDVTGSDLGSGTIKWGGRCRGRKRTLLLHTIVRYRCLTDNRKYLHTLGLRGWCREITSLLAGGWVNTFKRISMTVATGSSSEHSVLYARRNASVESDRQQTCVERKRKQTLASAGVCSEGKTGRALTAARAARTNGRRVLTSIV